MQERDALHHAERTTDALGVPPAAAEAAMGAVMAELAWHLETRTLSRAGLADVVEMLGGDRHARLLEQRSALSDAAAHADGCAILTSILGSMQGGRALALRAARRSGISERALEPMLPAMAKIAMARMAIRGQGPLGEVLSVMPSLGRWSRGDPHADLADILRRRCGGGPYAPGRLRRVVRKAIARAAGFPARRALRWYLHYLLIRPASGPVLFIAARALADSPETKP